MTQEALKLALDALENHTAIKHPQQIHYRDEAIAAIKEALAQPEQEPVDYEKLAALGWQSIECPFCGSAGALAFPQRTEERNFCSRCFCSRCGKRTKDIHTCTPPQENTWVGLTKKEVHDLYDADYVVFHQRIEAKLKEKNT